MSRKVSTVETRSAARSLANTILPGPEQGREQQAQGLPLALLGDAAGREDGPDQEVEREHVGDVIAGLVRAEEQQRRHSGIDSSMLTWITTRSISVPWLKISLRSSLSSTGLVPSGIRSVRLAGRTACRGTGRGRSRRRSRTSSPLLRR